MEQDDCEKDCFISGWAEITHTACTPFWRKDASENAFFITTQKQFKLNGELNGDHTKFDCKFSNKTNNRSLLGLKVHQRVNWSFSLLFINFCSEPDSSIENLNLSVCCYQVSDPSSHLLMVQKFSLRWKILLVYIPLKISRKKSYLDSDETITWKWAWYSLKSYWYC